MEIEGSTERRDEIEVIGSEVEETGVEMEVEMEVEMDVEVDIGRIRLDYREGIKKVRL